MEVRITEVRMLRRFEYYLFNITINIYHRDNLPKTLLTRKEEKEVSFVKTCVAVSTEEGAFLLAFIDILLMTSYPCIG